MGRKRYEIVSADVHILEPPDIWEKHLPKKFSDHAPRLVKDHEGGDAVCNRPIRLPQAETGHHPCRSHRWLQ